MNQNNQLIRFSNEINGKITFNTHEERFNSLTDCLMNYLCLVVGEFTYRITECEIYYNSNDHEDIYVHKGDMQLTAGKLYLNKVGGLDITFGNAEQKIWAGILIRGIRNLQTNKYTNKVTEIVSEIFDSLGDIINKENGIYFREITFDNTKEPVRSQRIGLTKKVDDKGNFIDKHYRYIVELVPEHKFRDKEKIVKQLLNEDKIKTEDIKNILGNNRNF